MVGFVLLDYGKAEVRLGTSRESFINRILQGPTALGNVSSGENKPYDLDDVRSYFSSEAQYLV